MKICTCASKGKFLYYRMGILSCLLLGVFFTLRSQTSIQDSLKHLLNSSLFPDDRISVLSSLIQSYEQSRDQFNQADKYILEGIELARRENLSNDLANFQLKLSQLRSHKGQIAMAYPHMVEAYAYFVDEGMKSETARIQLLLGEYYEYQGKSSHALDHYLLALKTFKSLGEHTLAADCYAQLGILFEHNKDYQKALGYRQKAFVILQQTQDTSRMASAIHNIAHTYGLLGRDSLAEVKYEEAQTLSQRITDTILVAHVQSGLGDIKRRTHQYHAALPCHRKAFQLFESKENLLNQGRESVHLAECYLHLDSLPEAQYWAEKSLDYAEKVNQLELSVRAYKLLTEIHQHEKNYPAAYAAQKRLLVLSDSLFNIQKTRELNQAETHFALQQQESQNRILRVQRYSLMLGLGLLIAITVLLLMLNRQRKRYNVTLEKTVSERTEMLRAKHEELKKMHEEVEHFVYIISHDLKQPVATINGYVGLLAKKYSKELDEKGVSYLNYITASTSWSKRLLDELLNYSRIGRTGEISQVDTGNMLRAILKEFHPDITKTRAYVHLTGDFPKLEGVFNDFHLVFKNLISNALKFHRKEVPLTIKIGAEEQKDAWQFYVEDNGIGIPEEYIDRIFTIFQRLHHKDEYAGTGYGLAACKKIMEVYGGTITVESEPGKGSTFFLQFPKNLSFEPIPVALPQKVTA